MFSDLCLAFRSFRKSPRFVAVAVLTLALGIGANTAFFSVLYGVALKPLPFPQPHQLVEVQNVGERLGANLGRVSRYELAEYRARQRSFDGIGSHSIGRVTLGSDDGAERVMCAVVTANLFPLLGVQPALGRGFEEIEETSGRGRVLVISHAFWQAQFGGAADVLGRTVRVDGKPHTVVGVMPAGFVFEDSAIAFWQPADLSSKGAADRLEHYLPTTARIKAGVTLAQAQADLDRIARELRAASPDVFPAAPDWSLRVVPLKETQFGKFRAPLGALLAAASAVLLIATVNVAIMSLLRSAVRRREMAIRLSLGAGRWHVVRQLLAESLLLCVAGGLGGLALSVGAIHLLKAFPPAEIPRLEDVALNVPTAAFMVGVLGLVTIVVGLAPALPVLSAQVVGGLHAMARVTEGRAATRAREALLVVEIALAVLLLIGGGLALRSLQNLLRDDVGFRAPQLFTFKTNLTSDAYPDMARANAFYERLGSRLEALPGVTAVAGVSYLPLSGESQYRAVAPLTPTVPIAADAPASSPWRVVRGPYFATLGTRLLHGRDFGPEDTAKSLPVAIVDDVFAERYWGSPANAVGQAVKFSNGSDAHVRTIVGVIHRMKHWGPGRLPQPEAYVPHAQYYQRGMYTVVKTTLPAATLARAARAQLAAVDATVPMYFVDTMEHRVGSALALPRFMASLVSAFSVLAVILAAVGVFGVTGYATAQRTREFGIRFAIGASRAHVIRLVLGRVGVLALIGTALGGWAALELGGLVRSQLYGVDGVDPVALLGAVALLTVGVFAATLVPVLQALRVNPAEALRAE